MVAKEGQPFVMCFPDINQYLQVENLLFFWNQYINSSARDYSGDGVP
jgi:hypothetical protein